MPSISHRTGTAFVQSGGAREFRSERIRNGIPERIAPDPRISGAMGLEILYCARCRLRILGADFDRARAFRVGLRPVCADCVRKELAQAGGAGDGPVVLRRCRRLGRGAGV